MMAHAAHQLMAHATHAMRWPLMLALFPATVLAQALSPSSVGPRPVVAAPKTSPARLAASPRSTDNRLPQVTTEPTKAAASAAGSVTRRTVDVAPPAKHSEPKTAASEPAVAASVEPPVKAKRRPPAARDP